MEKILTQEEFENGKPGYIWTPYVAAEHTEESLKAYKEFMAQYHKKHELCPKCGYKGHTSTLMGYILNREEDYKDLNQCVCTKCGDVHTCHERISTEDFSKSK